MAELDPQLVQILVDAEQTGIPYSIINNIQQKYPKDQLDAFLAEINRQGIQLVDDTPSFHPYDPYADNKKKTEKIYSPKDFADQGMSMPGEFWPKIQGTQAETDYEDRTIASLSLYRAERYRELLKRKMLIVRRAILSFFRLLHDLEQIGKVKIDEEVLKYHAKLAADNSEALIIRYNKYLDKINNRVYSVKKRSDPCPCGATDDQGKRRPYRACCGKSETDIGIDPLDDMAIYSACLKYANYYTDYKRLADAEDYGYIGFKEPKPPTSESMDMSILPIYRTIIGLNEDSFGYCYTTHKWHGAVCEGNEIILVVLSGSEAIAAREVSLNFPPILLENMPFRPDNPPKIIPPPATQEINDKTIFGDLEGKIKRGTRVTKCIICGNSTSIGSDYCSSKCREHDEDNIDDHHVNYVHYN